MQAPLPLVAARDCACPDKRDRTILPKTEIVMDELVNLVVQKTGMSQDDARKAVEVVVSAPKSKLPAPIAGHLDSFLSGGTGGGVSALEGEAGDLLKGKLSGLFGGGNS